MPRRWILYRLVVVLLGLGSLVTSAADRPAVNRSNESPAEPATATGTHEHITFGGGCFWCLEAVFQRLKGVTKVVSGYAGGSVPNPTYEAVCSGETGHAEVVQLTFDPAQVSYDRLLEVFWAAHDPTSVLEADTVKHGRRYPKGTAYQGADIGSHYRSIILFEDARQREAAEKSRREAQKSFKKPIATEIVPLQAFYPAEDYHQNYYNQNATRNSYCGFVITPKLQKLLSQGLIARDPVTP